MDKKMIVLAALAVVAIMNIASCALIGHDKRCARQGKWRVPEKTLFYVTVCFGGLGGSDSRRHKKAFKNRENQSQSVEITGQM